MTGAVGYVSINLQLCWQRLPGLAAASRPCSSVATLHRSLPHRFPVFWAESLSIAPSAHVYTLNYADLLQSSKMLYCLPIPIQLLLTPESEASTPHFQIWAMLFFPRTANVSASSLCRYSWLYRPYLLMPNLVRCCRNACRHYMGKIRISALRIVSVLFCTFRLYFIHCR